MPDQTNPTQTLGAVTPESTTQDPSTTTTTTPAPETKQQPQETNDDYVQRMAHLAKRERKLNEMAAKNKQLEEAAGKWTQYKDRASKGDIKAAYDLLSELGVSYEQLTEHLIQDDSPDAKKYRELENQIKTLQQEREKEREEAQHQRANTANDAYKQTIAAEAKANPDKYELSIQTYGDELADSAFEIILKDWEDRGRPIKDGKPDAMTQAQALDLIENYLEEQYQQSVVKLQKLKKFSGKFGNPVETPPNTSSTTTLSSFGNPTSANAAAPMTLEERKAAAIRALKG